MRVAAADARAAGTHAGGDGAVGQRQVFHRLVDAVQAGAGHGQAPRHRRAAREHDRVVARPQRRGGHVHPGVHPAHELGALGPHLGQPPVQVPLLHLELGDPVPQQPAGRVRALVHGDGVTGPGELLGGGEPGGPGPDHGDLLPGPRGRPGRPRRHPSLGPRPVDDLDFDLLDRHRVGVDAEHARALARRRAQPAGELGEVVGGVQPLGRLPPVLPPDQVVPLRDQVPQRAAGVAERDAAVHAAAGLALQRGGAELGVHLAPVLDPHVHRAAGGRLPLRGQESLRVSHARPHPCAAAMTASLTSRPSCSARLAASSTRL